MQKLDKLVLAAFKSASESPRHATGTAKAIEQALAALKTDSAKKAVTLLAGYLSQGGVSSHHPIPVDGIRALVSSRLTASAEFVLLHCAPKLANAGPEDVLPLIATTRALQEWFRLCSNHADARQTPGIEWLMGEAVRNPVWAVESVMAKGFVDLAPAAQLPRAAAFFIVPRGTRWFTAAGSLLLDALKRDKGGHFLEKLLRELLNHADAHDDIIAAIQSEALLFDKVIADLPAVISRDADGALQPIVAELFAGLRWAGWCWKPSSPAWNDPES